MMLVDGLAQTQVISHYLHELLIQAAISHWSSMSSHLAGAGKCQRVACGKEVMVFLNSYFTGFQQVVCNAHTETKITVWQ